MTPVLLVLGANSHSPFLICTAQVVGITAPTIYSSLTWACSHILLPPLLAHAPDHILAKQWLQAYQSASYWVPPLIFSGTIANGYLAYKYASQMEITMSFWMPRWLCYASAALTFASIMPWTLFYFEPYINGAGKWKVAKILESDADWKPMEEQKGLLPSPWVQTGNKKARSWAEDKSLSGIIREWGRKNEGRYQIGTCAACFSLLGTVISLNGFGLAR